jgi:hypothetical protein
LSRLSLSFWSGVGPHAVAPASLPHELLTSIVRAPRETPAYGIADQPLEPELFAEGVISTPGDESGGSMSPDGRDFYFRKVAAYTLDPSLTLMCVSHYRGGKWTKPEGLPVSGRYADSPPMLSPDGKQLFFSSQRPLPGEEPSSNPPFHIWVAARAENGWAIRDLCLPSAHRDRLDSDVPLVQMALDVLLSISGTKSCEVVSGAFKPR